MYGFAVIGTGLKDRNDETVSNREWFADDKTVSYRAAELAQTYPIVLVYFARKPHSTVSDGASPVIRYVNGKRDICEI